MPVFAVLECVHRTECCIAFRGGASRTALATMFAGDRDERRVRLQGLRGACLSNRGLSPPGIESRHELPWLP